MLRSARQEPHRWGQHPYVAPCMDGKTRCVKLRLYKGQLQQDCDTYIGHCRSDGGWQLQDSKWRTPFRRRDFPSTWAWLDKYKEFIVNSPLFDDLEELRGHRLGTWDHPSPCTGHVLVNLLEMETRYPNPLKIFLPAAIAPVPSVATATAAAQDEEANDAFALATPNIVTIKRKQPCDASPCQQPHSKKSKQSLGVETVFATTREVIVAERHFLMWAKSPMSTLFPCSLPWNGTTWSSLEHLYQYGRLCTMNKAIDAYHIKFIASPGGARRHGVDKLSCAEDARWRQKYARDAMQQFLRLKWDNCTEFRAELTRNRWRTIIEPTTDTFWGCGLPRELAPGTATEEFPGENVLGQLLMELVRKETQPTLIACPN